MHNIRFLDSVVHFVSPQEARESLLKEDDYTRVLSRFDIQGKVQTTKPDVTVHDYFDNAVRYLHRWTEYEIEYLKSLLGETEKKVRQRNFIFSLPHDILLIKSAMHEEGRANGFTRQNCIVLKPTSLSQHLLEHELFHIISRFNSELIVKAYKILGFHRCNEVQIPESLFPYKITNPDAPYNNFYVRFKYNGTDHEAITFLNASRDYHGGRFFNYVQKRLLLVEGPADRKVVIIRNGVPAMLSYEQAPEFLKLIGRNTSYNIHVEEVTSDHFTMALHGAVNLPDQSFIDQLTLVLQQKK